jgi:ABC-2 type transport system permease protein
VFGHLPRVAGATLLASVISLPILALIVVAVAVGGLWRAQGASTAVVILSMVLGVLTCGSRRRWRSRSAVSSARATVA